jgi:L-alanine-DL-glutamate epimerase-like enolase superfamily enzyme
MQITKITAIPLHVPVSLEIRGQPRQTSLSVCLCCIDTDQGLQGWGLTGITEEEVIHTLIEKIAGPALLGQDPLATEALWEKLYWLLTPRGQGGYASHAMSAIDIALWDIKAKAAGMPLWMLLGAARSRVPVYVTFGFGFMDQDDLVHAARGWVEQGFDRLKMTVGSHALSRRDEPRDIGQVILRDIERVRAVRQAVGERVELYVDANCGLDGLHARALALELKATGVKFFEEPIANNDVIQLRQLRHATGMPIAAGQNEGQIVRFREMLLAQAIDVAQPNVCISGGYTQSIRIAALARAFGVPIDNGGAWPFHNMHLHAGLACGGMVEHHVVAVEVLKQIYDDLPVPVAGWLQLPDQPGLGFEPNLGRIQSLALHPLSAGKGKA